MGRPLVQCRICKKKIDRDKETNWIMPTSKHYYHRDCYENWAKKKTNIHAEADEELWRAALWDYLTKDLKVKVDFPKAVQQWKKFVKDGFTPKGIYFCIRYFYEVQKGSTEKSNNGIGIVPYVYNDSCTYWRNRELQDEGICNRIEQQIIGLENREVVIVQKEERKKQLIKTYDLSFLETSENEE